MANITKIKASDDKAPKQAEKASSKKAKKVVAEPKQDKQLDKKNKETKTELDKAENKKLSRKKKRAAKKAAKAEAKANKPAKRIPVISYLKDSFQEIRQVRWPNRKETWKMTASVIIYVVVIALFITFLDALLEILFNKVLTMGN